MTFDDDSRRAINEYKGAYARIYRSWRKFEAQREMLPINAWRDFKLDADLRETKRLIDAQKKGSGSRVRELQRELDEITHSSNALFPLLSEDGHVRLFPDIVAKAVEAIATFVLRLDVLRSYLEIEARLFNELKLESECLETKLE